MLRAALIGFPSSGKTTLFQLMTSTRDAPKGKGDVNIGISKVPDSRLDVLTAMYNPRKRVPATVEFTDIIAPTRAGAQALVDVAGYKNADALVHVVHAFRDQSVPHPSGSIDPARDAQAMEDELILADLGVAERRLERLEKDLKKGRSAELEKERDLVHRCQRALEEGKPLRALELTGEDLKRLRGFQFLSAKPLLLVINLDEADLSDVGSAVEKAADKSGLTGFLAHAATRAVALCAKIELEIAQLEGDDAKAFLSDLGLSESGLDRVIRTSYDLLGYLSFFTVGEDECRAWSIARGTMAQAAAGEIHTDIQRGFIRAEVVAYDALTKRASMAACRDHGEVRLEGKEYIVQDGDIINFRFAT
ncbi:MAG TPA: redox-regulated ATPase YchF [Vicinamibacterales bacterium]|jgi:GTP-binding protein YchF|nr:redox-regulated ATPase YchF [Vicinamibacterales bacterium]